MQNNDSLRNYFDKPIENVAKIIMKSYRHGYTEGVHDIYDMIHNILDKKETVTKDEIEKILLSSYDSLMKMNKSEFVNINNR